MPPLRMLTSAPKQIGPYVVEGELGRGGMGVVYLARDPRLDRPVAVKVLPEEFTSDPNRVARFEREAKILAALNHPNLAAIFGVEEIDGSICLVLELAEGETLAERLQRGRLPLDEAIAVCAQIAAGIEGAHEAGVIHRDLKPANIKIAPDGRVKVLDFGLARPTDDGGSSSSLDLTSAPTVTSAATIPGVVLGTAGYMSPEQARGRRIDRRTDIWSLGCVLYECLTGDKAFEGDTANDTIAAILDKDPDWTLLPDRTPPRVVELLRKSLEKDHKQRLRDIGDARLELERCMQSREWSMEFAPAPSGSYGAVGGAGAATRRGPRWLRPGLVGMELGSLLVARVVWTLGSPGGSRRGGGGGGVSAGVVSFASTIAQPWRLDYRGPSLAVSPVGRRIVMTVERDGAAALLLREVDRVEAVEIEGARGGHSPFFSADGAWIGFTSGTQLVKVPVRGGSPQVVCEGSSALGACWGADGYIYFAPSRGERVRRVSADGGASEALPESAAPAATGGAAAVAEGAPDLLPGGTTLLITEWTSIDWSEGRIVAMDLKTGERRMVVERGAAPRYVEPRSLVFVREGSVFAAPFDFRKAEVSGAAESALTGVALTGAGAVAQWATSRAGTLAYIPGGRLTRDRGVSWVGRDGVEAPVGSRRGAFVDPRLSTDGLRVAMEISGANTDIWVLDTTRDALSRVTVDEAADANPVWTPDGQRIAFSSASEEAPGIYWRRADASGDVVLLLGWAGPVEPTSFFPDSTLLLFDAMSGETSSDIYALPLVGPEAGSPRPVLNTGFFEGHGAFSPDGRYIAYTSDESGRGEVYVVTWPGQSGKWQISTDGGAWPVWGPGGKELFFRSRDSLMGTTVDTTRGGFRPSAPTTVFQRNLPPGRFDVSPDGKRFLFLSEASGVEPRQVNVVVNWPTQWRRAAVPE